MMSKFQLFAVTDQGPQPLLVPEDAQDFADLYVGLSLGVYSAFRTFDHNKFLRLDAHLARTRQSMALTGMVLAWDEGAIRRVLHEVCTAVSYPEMRVRLDVLAEPARSLGTASQILVGIMSFIPYPASLYEMGVSVGIASALSRERPLAKTADFAAQRRAYTSAKLNDYLIVSDTGHILEGAGSNFYAVRDGVVLTAGEGVLEGVTRRIILGLLAQLNIPVRLEPIHAAEIPLLDEAAISSSSRGWLPVVEIDGQQVGNGRPGPISQQIRAAYDAYVAGVVETAV
jgi:branched-chain amino acid aminotransferase